MVTRNFGIRIGIGIMALSAAVSFSACSKKKGAAAPAGTAQDQALSAAHANTVLHGAQAPRIAAPKSPEASAELKSLVAGGVESSVSGGVSGAAVLAKPGAQGATGAASVVPTGTAGVTGAAPNGMAALSGGAGAVIGTGASAGTAQDVAAARPAAPLPPPAECFSVMYRHKKVAGHSSDEDCSHHKNIIHLKHGNVNPGAICVRVNGRPVPFQQVKGSAGDLLIGAVAGPESKIVANYCVGKTRCNDECKIPRDEFMDAIGGGDEEVAKAGKWDSSDAGGRDIASAKMDAEIRKEMAEIDAGVDVFTDWIGEDAAVLACSSKTKPTQVVAH